MVLLGDGDQNLRLVMSNVELTKCDGKAEMMVERLEEKGVVEESGGTGAKM